MLEMMEEHFGQQVGLIICSYICRAFSLILGRGIKLGNAMPDVGFLFL